MKKKVEIEKCDGWPGCKRKAVYVCDDYLHYFCKKHGEDGMECQICQPSYLIEL